nr:hypothetical protein CFP56_49644 [Quercus suber]
MFTSSDDGAAPTTTAHSTTLNQPCSISPGGFGFEFRVAELLGSGLRIGDFIKQGQTQINSKTHISLKSKIPNGEGGGSFFFQQRLLSSSNPRMDEFSVEVHHGGKFLSDPWRDMCRLMWQ